MRDQIKKELENRLDQMIADLRGLIQIPSIAGEPEGDYPFGLPVQHALDYMLELGASMGFAGKDVDHYGGHIDFPGTEAGIMALVSHIDVVPVGDGWTHGPFDGQVAGGVMFGRGTQDDKSSAIMCLHAMKVLKDLGFEPKKTVRLILGLDEEANWDGMRYYLSKEQAPDFGIVPDAEFPLVQCEKGLLQFELVPLQNDKEDHAENHDKDHDESETSCRLIQLTGGAAPNIVAGQAAFTITGTEQELLTAEDRILHRITEAGYHSVPSLNTDAEPGSVSLSRTGGQLLVETKGKPAHAATPEAGLNAISIAMDLLSSLKLSNTAARRLVAFYQKRIGFAVDGSRIGCAMEDQLSGKLSFNVGMVRFDAAAGEVHLIIDVRYPVTLFKEAVYDSMSSILQEEDYRTNEIDHIHSIYLESSNPIVTTLLEVYQEVSGDTEHQPIIMGGATFARAIPNCIAYGPLFPGDPELAHQKDECIDLSQMLKATQIYAEAIYRLTQ